VNTGLKEAKGKRMAQVLLIGAGNMGYALLQRWAEGAAHRLTVVEPDDALRARAGATGAATYAGIADLPTGLLADVAVIATKPQVVPRAIAELHPFLRASGLLVSIAAGVTLRTMFEQGGLEQGGRDIAIIRCMPNMPAVIGEGMIVCCADGKASPVHRDLARQLLSAVGRTVFVEDEALMDAVTAVSGSGPAYVFHLLEAFCAAGVCAGLPEDLAMTLVKQTVFGAARLAMESEATPDRLRRQVTSPGGTTAAALEVLMESNGLGPLMARAVEAARRRSVELGAA
jgi:pyrroline-5-carboxylate reductase